LTATTTNKILISTCSWLVYLIPFSLLTGPFLPDLSIVIINVILGYLIITNKEWKYLKNGFTIFFLVFYFYLLFSSLLSQNIYLSLESSLFYFRFFVFSLAVWFLIDHNDQFIKMFTLIFTIIFTFVIIDGYVQLIYGSPIFNISSITNNRLMLSFNEKLVLGNYISRLFPLLFGLILYKISNRKSILAILLVFFILSDLLVYLSGERTAFGLMVFSTILLIIMISKYKIIRLISFGVASLLILFITINSGQIRDRMINQTLDQMNFNSTKYKKLIFSPEHDSIYRSSFNMFLANPITGIGPKNFRELCNNEKYKVNDRGCSTHPHNTYVQALAETGLIGFSFLFFLGLYVAKEILLQIKSLFIGKPRLNDYQICLIVCFSITLFPFLPTLSLFNNWINIVYFLPVGFYLQSKYNK
tara:strand:+ start:3760 stop:5007 length:1248 start_codon:yes stop_codon:yes gene_type:complete